MPDLILSSGVRRRERGNFREAELLNMYLEPDPTAPDGFARISRPGLGTRTTVGTGPIYGLFTRRGVFDDDLFAISGAYLFRGADSLGGIDGDGAASFAASGIEVVTTRGARAWSYDGTDLADIAFPDDADVTAVAFLGGYHFFIKSGTHTFYWGASLDARTIDGLDFASAESEPDELLDVYVVNDSLWFMGKESVEAWQLTGDADQVVARIEGLLLKKGIIATGCACEADNSLFWWGHDNMIYRGAQGVPQRVSDNTIEEILAASVEKDMFSFTYEGHVFVCVRTDEGTFGLDVSVPTGGWCELGTYQRDNWRAVHAATPGGELVFGSDEDGRIFEFQNDNWDDDTYLERKFSATFDLNGGAVVVNSISIVGNPGETPLLSGEGSEPQVEFRASRDNGKRFGDWRQAPLGAQGKYRQRIEKRRWGLYDRQGGVFQFRCTDPVPFRASRVYANEPSGGKQVR